MEIETLSSSIDDGFNDFVHKRTADQKVKDGTATYTELLSPAANAGEVKGMYGSSELSTMSDVHRSDGSGSENGNTELPRDTLHWYRNEKQLSDKYSTALPSIHSSNLNSKIFSPIKCDAVTKWRAERMESFESNKEYIGSECGGSRLSLYSQPGREDWEGEDGDWEDDQPTGERWPPLGAPNDDDNQSICSFEELGRARSEAGRLKELEEEQEQLNSSLMSLTSHFAQVQFRLKQIVSAQPEEKEKLLRDLEEFADRGIPDLRAIQHTRDAVQKSTADQNFTEQKELIERLKQQLDELEQYAYQAGEADLPQTVLVSKQKVVLDQLKGKLPLDLDDIGHLSAEDLRAQVDLCVKQLINPLKMKEQLVSQLQTQIGDLERFIDFLQDDGQKKLPEGALSPSKCQCGGHGGVDPLSGRAKVSPVNASAQSSGASRAHPSSKPQYRRTPSREKQLQDDTASLVDRATLLLNMLRFAQLGCGPSPPSASSDKNNGMVPTPKGVPHWGDLRATLEVSIATLVELLSVASSTATSDSEASRCSPPVALITSQQVTLAVRKQLVPALRDLMEHGLIHPSSSRSVVSVLSCFPDRSSRVPSSSNGVMHAWELVLEYYHLKRGDYYNTTPARRLSQSFNLELSNSGGQNTGHKGALLAAVGSILSTHTPLKRSHDSHFKAFVSEGLNQQRLVVWLRLIMRSQTLINQCYQRWSYAVQTGFDDALKSLEALQQFRFNLPVDLAVRSLRNITDAF